MLSIHKKIAGLLCLILPGALLLALPDGDPATTEPDAWFQVQSDPAEPGLLFSGPSSFALPIVVPLESAIGRRHLGARTEVRRRRFRIGPGALSGIPAHLRGLAFRPGLIPLNLREDLISLGWTYYTGDFSLHGRLDVLHTTPFVGFDPGETLHAELFAGYAPGNGKDGGESRRELNLLLGLTADFHNADIYRDEELAHTAYGTVFLAPGLQLAGRRMLFEATVELPLRRSRHVPDRYRDKVRGNIGMKYFLQ